MKTPAAVHTGAATAWQSGNAVRTAMKVFFGLSLALLVCMIVLAIQVQCQRHDRYVHGPAPIIKSLEGGHVSTCKVVSIRSSEDPLKFKVRLAGSLGNSHWQKEGIVIMVNAKNNWEIGIEVEDVVRLYLDGDGKAVLERVSFETSTTAQFL